MKPPFAVTQDAQQITPTVTENATHYELSFTHTRSSSPIKVAGSDPGSQTVPPPQSTTSAQDNISLQLSLALERFAVNLFCLWHT